MERLDLIESQEFFDNPIFKEEEQEFKRNELDSLSLAGLSLAASGTICFKNIKVLQWFLNIENKNIQELQGF